MRTRFSNEERSRILEDWKQSGKTMWSYAKEKGIIPQTFTRWVKLAKESKQIFVEVQAQKSQYVLQQQEILIEKGELKIHVPLSVWKEHSSIIFNGLKAAP